MSGILPKLLVTKCMEKKPLKIQQILMRDKTYPRTTVRLEFNLLHYLHLADLWSENINSKLLK